MLKGKLSENYIERRLCEAVTKMGGITYKLSALGRVNKPDRVIMLPHGKVLFIECKAEGKKPKENQLREHKRLRDLGMRVIVINSLDFREVFD